MNTACLAAMDTGFARVGHKPSTKIITLGLWSVVPSERILPVLQTRFSRTGMAEKLSKEDWHEEGTIG